MSTEGRTARTTGRESLSDPAYQAFLALRTVFTVCLLYTSDAADE